MKKIITALFVLLLAQPKVNAQQILVNHMEHGYPINPITNTGFLNVQGSPPEKDADFYLNRSRNQRIVGWTTLGAGLLLSGVGVLVATNSSDDIYDESDETTAGVLLAAGAASGIASIPFMIMATVNKHKARVMLNNQKTGFGVPPNVSSNIPGITCSIQLGK